MNEIVMDDKDWHLKRGRSKITQTPIQRAMQTLAEAGAIFIGQNVAVDGSAMFKDFAGIPFVQRIELPVCENLQMGMATGLALQGFLPVCIYPRIDFMLLAMDQLVNHLDKMQIMGGWNPKVIIRTKVGAKTPLDAGPQHTQSHAAAFKLMLTNVDVVALNNSRKILSTYKAALASKRSTLVVENLCS